jgi:hypothetical protein
VTSAAIDRDLATAYEQLRNRVLEGAAGGGPFGLVILLREGVAAWMARAVTCPATLVRGAANDRPSATPLVADGVRSDLVAVLASMVMTTRQERCA